MSAHPPARRGGFPLRLDQLGKPAASPRAVVAPVAPPPAQPPPSCKPVAAAVRTVLRPQALLQHAATLAARPNVPSGLGLDSAGVRRRMVERLRVGGLRDERVIEALAEVPRHLFVDTAFVPQAYEDTSLPIGHGQTISKPSVVSRMVALLMEGASAGRQGGLGRVLEIGTGCGYQAAVLAVLARQVISIERLAALHQKARDNLEPLRALRDRIRLVHGDGMLGHAPNAPYDSIICGCRRGHAPAGLARPARAGRAPDRAGAGPWRATGAGRDRPYRARPRSAACMKAFTSSL